MNRKFLQAKDSYTSTYSTAKDRQQFEEIYYAHIDALYHYGSKFKANQELVEDCIQDLFADLWEKNPRLDNVNALRSYLLGALRRKLLRKVYHDREQVYDIEEWNGFFEMRLIQDPEEQQTLSEEHIQRIICAFGKLTEKQKEVIYLRFYNQLSFKEIAEVMEVQTRTIYKLAHRSISLLKEELTPYSPALQLLLLSMFC